MSKPLHDRQRIAVPHGVDPEEWLEAVEERAAILEFDGGLNRQRAEREAWKYCLAEFRRRSYN